ncbi:MAG: exodeoxyribonuclease VII large subunit [Planctomycetota bacterium]
MTGFLFGEDSEKFFSPTHGKPRKSSKPASSGNSTGTTESSPLSVSELNVWIKRTLDQSIASFWIAGEVSGVMQSSSGHVYLTLKDDSNQISAVLWRSTWEKFRFDLRDGMAVLCRGKLDMYGPRGSVQVILDRIEPQGLGALQLAFRKLHAQLEAEGLFRSDRKRPLPRFPVRIGFVTSPHGAAIHDFLEVLRRRWPQANVLVIPSRVQGEGSADEIARAIELAGLIQPPLDVLIVGRGGGSIEDLWSFNEEVVVRAIAASPIPTVSAVGHEIDVTLCDLAADVRALTPSEAAERIVPNRDEILETLQTVQMRLAMLMSHKVREQDARLTSLTSRPAFVHPERMLDTAVQRMDEAERACNEATARWLDHKQHHFEKLATQLEAISPLKTLARGYSLTLAEEEHTIVRSIDQVRVDQAIVTRLADGQVLSKVTSVESGIRTNRRSREKGT